MSEEILVMRDISKHFGGVQALCDVDFSCNKGEIHALIGENGAGKSTLLKILSGVYRKDKGDMIYKGGHIDFHTPEQAQHHGIVMVYQELTLINELNVAENVFLSIEPRNKAGFVDKKRMYSIVSDMMKKYDIDISPKAIVGNLTVAQQQMIEILKILVRNAELIIFDEPTSALGKDDVAKLFQIIKTLRDEGKTIIFISHRLEEIFEISQRITVLKDGRLIGTKSADELDTDSLITMMVGRKLEEIFPQKEPVGNEVIFEVRNLSSDKVRNVSFSVHKGEIVSLAGLAGHGQSDVLNIIAGITHKSGGEIIINGREVSVNSPWKAIKEGVALVPSDRKTEGLSLSLSIRHNLSLASLGKRQLFGFISTGREKRFTDDMVSRLRIKTKDTRNEVSSLSGGNQQKVVLGKELAIEPRVLLFNEPTRGIDVESKSEVYKIMRELASKGIAIIMLSADLVEVIGVSDQIIVMYEGSITGKLLHDKICEENIMRCAVGIVG